jgi:hypothetical protein
MHTIFFFMGVLTVTAVLVLARLNRPVWRPWYVNTFALAGALLLIFTFGWCASSLVEGELRAAKVGLVVFGLPTLALFFLTQILVGRKERTSSGV